MNQSRVAMRGMVVWEHDFAAQWKAQCEVCQVEQGERDTVQKRKAAGCASPI